MIEDSDRNKPYYSILVHVTKSLPEEVDLGCAREEIGTHSNRKFAESMAVSRIDGPNPNRSLVYLRAGQSVGGIQDCYMSKKTIEMRLLEEFCHF